MKVKNARIVSTELGYEAHGIPTCILHLDYGGSSQGFGGYNLRHHGIEMLLRIIAVVGVQSWEGLTGQPVRVRMDNSQIQAIGNIIKDDWYKPLK